MNFRQLETFRWIAKLGSFSAAAERLNATQSTVSSRIAELEQSLGTQLFDRQARSAHLTAKGRALLRYAEEAARLSAAISAEIAEKDTLSGVVRIGVGEIVALSWLPSMLAKLATIYPRIEVELVIDVTVNLMRLLDANELDIVFIVVSHHSPQMLSRHLGRVSMHWVASPSLGLGDRVRTPEELSEMPIISLSRESHMFEHIEAWFSKHGLRPRRVHGCNSITTMIAMVKNGFCIAVLPKILIEPELASKQLEILAAESPVDFYDFFVVHDRDVSDRQVLAISQSAFESTTFSGFERA